MNGSLFSGDYLILPSKLPIISQNTAVPTNPFLNWYRNKIYLQKVTEHARVLSARTVMWKKA